MFCRALGSAISASEANLELSLHVQRIDAWPDGRIEMRTCKLGIFEGAAELLTRDLVAGEPSPSEPPLPARGETAPTDAATVAEIPVQHRVTSRRRSRLRTAPGTDGTAGTLRAAAAPDRFTGLDPHWFWIEPVNLDRRWSWAEENARAVWQRHLQNPRGSLNDLARAFPEVSRPTVAAALKLARQQCGVQIEG